MTRKTLIATATAIFAAGSFATAAHAAGVKCVGANSSSCKGQNACKGQGWTETTDVVSCTAQGGKVAQ